ncbi:MAG: glycosyltransferase [Verrucomicrobiae bacterium]|nr:glycosyltransferase [Verrucomicrobiae bacterium]
MDLSVVIPVFNQLELTKRCLESLDAHTRTVSHEVIIVDNASTDGTAEYFSTMMTQGGAGTPPSIQTIRNEENRGFGIACNQGAKLARGKVLVFLNNDTEVKEGWAEWPLRDFREQPDIGIIGNKLLYPDGTIQHAGVQFVKMVQMPQVDCWPIHRLRAVPGDLPQANQPEDVHAVTGACLFIPRDLFWEAGGFCEDYGMYFEDTDLNLKIRRMGRRIFYEPRSVVIHHEGKSSRNRLLGSQLLLKAAEIFYSKWEPSLKEWRATLGPWAVVDTGPLGELGVRWDASFLDRSGYAQAARQYVMALSDANVRAQAGITNQMDWSYVEEMSMATRRHLERLAKTPVSRDVYILSWMPVADEDMYRFFRNLNSKFGYYVGYTTFEADRVPECWVNACAGMDEIWVPSRFNRDAFAASGLPVEKVKVVPHILNEELFCPKNVRPLEISGVEGFCFLSVFEWSLRKGWDVLFKAYRQAFTKKDDVTLLIHANCRGELDARERLAKYFKEAGEDPSGWPRIVTTPGPLKEAEMAALYRRADAFVLPTRGEGWGIPFMEAMAMELPAIGTGWGGQLDFMNDANSYLADFELREIPHGCDLRPVLHPEFYWGARWAEPSADHMARLMRQVYERREEAKEKGRAARAFVTENFNRERVAATIIKHLKRIRMSPVFVERKTREIR